MSIDEWRMVEVALRGVGATTPYEPEAALHHSIMNNLELIEFLNSPFDIRPSTFLKQIRVHIHDDVF
jgi:hypothetical protein